MSATRPSSENRGSAVVTVMRAPVSIDLADFALPRISHKAGPLGQAHRVGAQREPLNVRFALRATELLGAAK